MTTTQLTPTPVFKGWDNNGRPLAFGLLYSYEAGTTTPTPTYTDSTGLTPNTNPVVLNARGEAPIWLNPTQGYKLNLTDSTGNQIPNWPVDNIIGPLNINQSLIPAADNTYDLGSISSAWRQLYLGANHSPALDTVSGIIGYYPRTPAEIAASVTPVNFAYQPGDIRRYGAASTNTDNGPAINNALRCNPIAFDGNTSGPIVYQIKTTINFQAAGQILRGAGFGDNNTAGGAGAKFAPRTTLQWTGSSAGAVVSLSDGVANYSETSLEDICIDGNGVASKGVAYDDTLTTGCWRNVLRRVAILNCTQGTNPSAVYFGNNASGFVNDASLHDCYLWACGNGVYGTGAIYQLFHCTVGLMTVAGLHLPGNGAEANLFGGVFHTNAIDILIGDAGTPIQAVACFGTWFENSTNGVFDAHNSFNLQMVGCHLHTFSSAYLMNFRGQAGEATIKCLASNSSTSYLIANTNPSYDYDLVGTGITTDTGFKLKVEGLGVFDNAKFAWGLSATSVNSTGDGTLYTMNANAVVAQYDLASAVTASTGIFTAPATGYYRFRAKLALTGVLSAHNDAQLFLIVAGTSAQTYQISRTNPGAQLVAGTTESDIAGEATVPMTKADTAYIGIQVSGSTKVVGVFLAGSGQSYRTRCEGQLV